SKWVFKVKSGANGALERFKSRLVAKGFQQKEKVDFGEIFAPVVKPVTLRTVLAGAAVKGWHMKQMDITTAFLNGILLEDIYMAQPDGYEDGTSRFSAGGQLKQIGADGVTPGTLKLSCFTDATWASEDEDQSSVGGFVCMVGGGLVSWRFKKQSEIAQSSGEAEYMAMYHAIKEIVLLRKLLEDMGTEQEGPTPLFSDKEAAIGMAINPILNGLNKHMKIKWHWVRLMVKECIVELHYVKASKQAADFLTKRLPESAHWKCAKMCGMALH
ncbi:unnamed protein product, partial [Closterium sp. NIES-53]